MVTADDISRLRQHVHGEQIGPDDEGYDAARRVYNAMIDRYPRLIVRCADVADVIAGVRFAAEHDLLLAVRGGGHNGAGLGVCDDGMVLDLARMRGIRVDPNTGTVRVEAGATWGDVDHATHAFGLAVPSGIVSSTGVGGLTLGGGIGNLARMYGLTIDSLIEADLVLADGRVVTASADTHRDLFWAIRGGGGNFGVVTSFLFRGRPVRDVVAGPTLWPLERAADVLRWYRDFLPAAPRQLNGWFAFLKVPPEPPFPDALHRVTVCGVVWCYVGPADQAEEVFRPIRAFGPPILDGVQPMPFPALQGAFDHLYPRGDQWYWRADFVDEIPDAAVEQHQRFGSRLPTFLSTMHLYPIDGAVRDVDPADTAFSYRDATWASVFAGVGVEAVEAPAISRWSIDYFEALHPYSAGGAYVNMMMDEGEDRVRASYRGNYARLAQVKAAYDPDNLFRINQNIRPAG